MSTPELPEVAVATFKPLPDGPAFEVHFNPASLTYTVSNTLKEEGDGGTKKQYVDKTTAKLAMELVFDTTDTGEDVRTYTEKMAGLLEPVAEDQKQVPPNVEFAWGTYTFTGMVEQYRETLDFFAPSGVPLRATVALTLASQDVEFEREKGEQVQGIDRDLTPEPAVVSDEGGPAGVANALSDPRAARAIAGASGSASLRFGTGGGVAVGAGVELRAEAAFSAGASAGVGFGIGGGGGIGIGGGAGVGFSASLGGGGAAGGAFSGLRVTPPTPRASISARALLPPPAPSASVGSGSRFGVGGKAATQTGSSLRANVGADADLSALVKFS